MKPMNTDPSEVHSMRALLSGSEGIDLDEEEDGVQRPVVLLVDGEERFRRAVLNMLSDYDYAVLTETSAKAAIDTLHRLVQREESVVVITDLLMTQSEDGEIYGGFDVLAAARGMGNEIPVVLMSTQAAMQTRQDAYRQGADHFLAKPDLSHSDSDATLRDFGVELSLITQRLSRFANHAAQSGFGRETPLESFVGASSMQLHLVKTIIEELQDPEASQEISLLILRLAAEYLERGVLFLVRNDQVVGLGGFGKTGDHEFITEKTRRLEIPLTAESVFHQVMETLAGHKGQLPKTELNQQLIQGLGTIAPTEALVLPVKSRNRVVAFLYGDNGATRKPIGDTEGLEIFLSQAGIAMENTFLQRQLASFEKM